MLCSADDSNTMSVTMVLRRSPDLNVAALGGMNLVSSTTLRQPIPPPSSRAQSPQLAMSNNSLSGHPEHVAPRAHPKGRNSVVPHAIHLRDLQGSVAHGDLGSEVEDERVAGKAHVQSWHPAQHGRSTEHSMQHMSQHAQRSSSVNAQRARFSGSVHAQTSNHPRLHAHMDASPEEAAFDLYHHSQMLNEQLPAGMKWELSDDTSTGSAAPGRPLPSSRASSISPTGALTMGGAYSIQGPALDTDAVAANAADASGSCSIQPSALATQLSGRSSTVRFMLASDPSQDPSAVSLALIPHTVEDDGEHAGHAVLQSQGTKDSMPHGADEALALDKRTLSLSSTASSLKGVLKKTTSKGSAVSPLFGGSQALGSAGVSFALGAGDEDSSNDDTVSAMQSSALLKQGSESFPSWLTDG